MSNSCTNLLVFCIVVISAAIPLGGCEDDLTPISVPLQCSTPTFCPCPGTYTSPQSVEILCATEGATIRYTTDNSEPVETSARYARPIQISGDATINARAWKENYNYSAVATASYIIILDVVSAPTFDPPPGEYVGVQNIEITCATEGAMIRYTTDESEPTEIAIEYTEPIEIIEDTTIKARAWKEDLNYSAVATASYIIIPDVVATPSLNPLPGTYEAAQNVEISCATQSATIRYTTDGSEPTEIAVEYTEPIEITEDTTIKAKAWKANMEPSGTRVGSYFIEPVVQVSTPTFSPGPGTYQDPLSVSIACSTEGATIRYTTNGSWPIETSTLYSEPIQVMDDMAMKAKAWKGGQVPSQVTTGAYVIAHGTAQPELLLPGPCGNPGDIDPRHVLWLDRPDFAASVVSSEIMGTHSLETEVASDFVLEWDACIVKMTWWGAYWNGNEGAQTGAGFNLRFYMDAGCLPDTDPYMEYLLPGDDCCESLAADGDMFSQYVYEVCLELCLPAGQYWFSVQMAEHDWAFPPQWGRLGTDSVRNCSSCVRSEYFGYPDWQPLDSILDAGFDISQMLEDECPFAAQGAGWRAVERLFR